jgi:hypothetical protein
MRVYPAATLAAQGFPGSCHPFPETAAHTARRRADRPVRRLRVRTVILGKEEILPGEACGTPCPLDQFRQDRHAVKWKRRGDRAA